MDMFAEMARRDARAMLDVCRARNASGPQAWSLDFKCRIFAVLHGKEILDFLGRKTSLAMGSRGIFFASFDPVRVVRGT